MASASSGVIQVTTGTSVRNRKTSYYQTEVTELSDGGLKSTMYRTDANGNNKVAIENTTVDKEGKRTRSTTSNATEQEKKSLASSTSQINAARKTQVRDVQKKLHGNNADVKQKSQLDKVGGGSGNSDSVQKDQTSTPTTESGSSFDVVEGTNKNIPGKDSPLRYPTDIAETSQDVIKFDMLEYSPKPLTQGGKFGTGKRKGSNERILASAILAIPGNINDSNSTGWGDGTLTALEAEAANIAISGIEGGGKKFSESIGESIGKLSGNSEDVKKAVASSFAGAATGIGQGLLTRSTGSVINPNLELLFKGPSLRPFDFTFLLAPRSKDEADQVINIIRFFKQGMAPIRTKSNLFLKSPNTFKVQYLHRGESGKEHFALNKFKECALLSLNVNYTPNANYATFSDGTMVAYQLTMRFQELEPVYNDDYGSVTNEIGF